MYPLESPHFAEKLSRRKEGALQTLRPKSTEELHALSHELFPDGTHPWAATFSQFVEEHKTEPAFRGEASEGIVFVYYPRSNRGIWRERIGEVYAVGLLNGTALKMLSEVMSENWAFLI